MSDDKFADACSEEYWRKSREYYLAHPDELGIHADEEKYKVDLAKKRGLLFSSTVLVSDSLRLIACGLTEAGLAKARMAKHYAEAALEVGDLVHGHEPIESGKHIAHRSLAAAKWILGEPGWEPLLRESADWWCAYLNSPKKYDPFLRRQHIWQAIIPFLLVGDIARAAKEYGLAYAGVWPDPVKVAQNACYSGKVFGVVVGFLSGNADMADTARETLAKFRHKASRWGNEEGWKTRPLKEEMFIEYHILLARVWATFFDKEDDPVKIIQSIRG